MLWLFLTSAICKIPLKKRQETYGISKILAPLFATQQPFKSRLPPLYQITFCNWSRWRFCREQFTTCVFRSELQTAFSLPPLSFVLKTPSVCLLISFFFMDPLLQFVTSVSESLRVQQLGDAASRREEESGWERAVELLSKTGSNPEDENLCDGAFLWVFQRKMSPGSPYSWTESLVSCGDLPSSALGG